MKRFFPLAFVVLLASCGLSPSIQRQISEEHRQFQSAQQDLARTRTAFQHDLAADPALFQNAPEPSQWTAELDQAEQKFQRAATADQELSELARRNRRDQRHRAEDLLFQAQVFRAASLKNAHSALDSAQSWLDFKDHLSEHVASLEHDYESLHDDNLSALSQTVAKAEHDWPAKKDLLAARYSAISDLSQKADNAWSSTSAARAAAEAGKATDPQIASLIETGDAISADRNELRSRSAELSVQAGQLYNSWDKILVDLDDQNGDYRERVRTIRTHISDPSAHESETSSSEQWVAVSQPVFNAVKNDLGMAIAHKSAGLFDSEATTTPQPAGFAYIAPESVGHNQYGYWSHDNGQSVWTWLPQYLILRQLLWNHAYRPVVLDEYRGYQTAQTAGKTYYGSIGTAAPKYGTHGTFTKTGYASSRYVQTGGFRTSGYSSRTFNSQHSESQRRGSSFYSERGGKRFGASRSGRGFGRGAGRSFGRSFGRGFGKR